jgi:predicted exporter
MLMISRTFFVLIISFIVFFITSNINNDDLRFSSSLTELSPTLSKDITTQKAISKLSEDIQRRFFIVIKSSKHKNIAAASNYFKDNLGKNKHIIIDNTESIENILAALKPYRFQLLSPMQRIEITHSPAAKIIENTQRQLFRIENSFEASSFIDDPLNTFGNYINHLLGNNFSQESVSKNNKNQPFTIISAYIKHDLSIKEQSQLSNTIDRLGDELLSQYDVRIIRSGVFFFAEDAAKKSESDIKLISIISSAAIIGLLLLVFRSLLLLVLPFASICIGILFATSINFYFYGYIHLLTIVFGSSLIGIIIDYSLHYFYHLKPHKPLPSSKNLNILSSPLYRAMLFSLITSIIGYSALSFSNLDILKKIALFSCCGIFASWLSVMTLGSLIRPSQIKKNDFVFTKINHCFNEFLSLIAQKLSFKSWGIILAGIAITLTAAPPNTNDSPRLFFNAPISLLEQEVEAVKFNQNFEPGQYLILSGDAIAEIYSLHNQFLLEFTSTQQIHIDSNIDSDNFFSPMQVLPSPDAQHKNYQLQKNIYEPSGITEQLFEHLGLPSKNSDILFEKYLKNSDRQLRPELIFNSTNNLPPLWSRNENNNYISFMLIKKGSDLEAIRKTSLKYTNIQYFDTLALSTQALAHQRLSSSRLLALAYALIALLLLVIYRNYKQLSLLLIPASATLLTLVVFKLFNIHITLFHSMGFFLILGLGMDYGIFIKEMTKVSNTNVNANNSATLNAILFSTITTLCSFGLLALSAVPVAKAFGLTLLIGNTINFFSALLYGLLANKQINSTLKKEQQCKI